MPKSSNRKHDTRRANRDRRQRLEELRKQQRASERRKNLLFAGGGTVLAVALILGAVIPAYLHDRSQKAKEKVGYQAAPTAAEKAAGCLGLHNDPVSPAAQHVPNKPIDYTKEKYGDTRGGTEAIPPSGGKHNPIPLGDKNRFYPLSEKPRPERAVHNLEHGYVVAWYDSKLPQSDVAKLQKLAADPSLSELIVTGWWQGDLPAGKHFVLTSWGRTDRCGSVSDTVVHDFYNAHVNDSKLAPEVGSGSMGGDKFPANDLNTTPVTSATTTTSPAASASASTKPSASSQPAKK
ncbi:MAG TPA: DUF3105 domain-containing protein [Mycobacteriales bacterium]|nr:DUF3105 domain-containing protein [Mycobacteriales bacterium]